MGTDDHDAISETLEVAPVLGRGQLVRLVLISDARLLAHRLCRPPSQPGDLYYLYHLSHMPCVEAGHDCLTPVCHVDCV